MVFVRSPSPRRAVSAHKSAAVIARFPPWCCSVSWAEMPSVKKIAVMHALALTVPSARMIFRRKGEANIEAIQTFALSAELSFFSDSKDTEFVRSLWCEIELSSFRLVLFCEVT